MDGTEPEVFGKVIGDMTNQLIKLSGWIKQHPYSEAQARRCMPLKAELEQVHFYFYFFLLFISRGFISHVT
jgi:hypothetical protein